VAGKAEHFVTQHDVIVIVCCILGLALCCHTIVLLCYVIKVPVYCERYDRLRIHASDMSERITTWLLGDVEEDTVLVSDRVLTFWSIVMYSLGMFTGLGIWMVLAP